MAIGWLKDRRLVSIQFSLAKDQGPRLPPHSRREAKDSNPTPLSLLEMLPPGQCWEALLVETHIAVKRLQFPSSQGLLKLQNSLALKKEEKSQLLMQLGIFLFSRFKLTTDKWPAPVCTARDTLQLLACPSNSLGGAGCSRVGLRT